MKKTIIAVVSLIILLVVVVYGYEFIFKKPVIESPTIQEEEMYLPTLEVKEQYKDSKYTFVGSVQVPTPCHSLESKVQKISEQEYQILITTTPPKAGVMCAQVMTDKTYKVSFDAPQDIKVSAYINGIKHELNRFVIPSDQDIDAFQLEIKG